MRFIKVVIAVIISIGITMIVGSKILISSSTYSNDSFSEIHFDLDFNKQFYPLYSFKTSTESLTLTRAAVKLSMLLTLFVGSLTFCYLVNRIVQSLRLKRTKSVDRVSLTP